MNLKDEGQHMAENANGNSPVVIAHRGACGYLPEHTLEGVAMAHAMRVDFIEQDVVLTQDDVPVVLHDIHLDTVTDVAKKFPDRARDDNRYYAIDFTLAEIKQLSAHERIDLETGQAVFENRFDYSKTMFKVPTLVEEIELIQGLNRSTGRDIGIYPEIKSPAWHRQQGKDLSQVVLKTLKQYGYASKKDNVFLQCFDADENRRIREELNCDLKMVQLIGDNSWNESDTDYDAMQTEEGIKEVAQYVDAIGPWMPLVRQEDGKNTNLVQLAHASGLLVHVYTLRKDSLPKFAESFEQALSMLRECQVDGLFTDFADLAVHYFSNRTV